MIVTNMGKEDIGLYFLGSGDLDGSETLSSTLSPGSSVGQYVSLDDSFAIRSGDLVWRSRLTVYANEDETQPFKLSFHNVMVDDDAQPIELQHHDEGFLWIEPNHHVTHSSIGGHKFIVKDKGHNERYSVEIHQLDHDEL